MSNEKKFVPFYPYGDPEDGWQIDSEDFYQRVDAAFDAWLDANLPNCNMGSAMPYDLTALEPEGRLVNWKRKQRKYPRREDSRKVHPEVADEMERLQDIHRPSKEECSRQFSPSPLAIFRAGFSEGVSKEKSRHNADWGSHLEKYPDGRDGWVVNSLKQTVRSNGADYAHQLLDQVIAELENEDRAEPPASKGLLS